VLTCTREIQLLYFAVLTTPRPTSVIIVLPKYNSSSEGISMRWTVASVTGQSSNRTTSSPEVELAQAFARHLTATKINHLEAPQAGDVPQIFIFHLGCVKKQYLHWTPSSRAIGSARMAPRNRRSFTRSGG